MFKSVFVLYIAAHAVLGIEFTTCPNGWVAFSGSCYYFKFENMHFTEAEAYCRQHDSHLIHVNNDLENAFIKDRLRHLNSQHWWLGMTDEEVEGVFKWFDTDTVVEYTDWHAGQPDVYEEDCAVFWTGFDFQWGDVTCTRDDVFTICERIGEEAEAVVGK